MIDEPSGAKCLYIYISKFGIEIALIFDSIKKKCLYILLGNYIFVWCKVQTLSPKPTNQNDKQPYVLQLIDEETIRALAQLVYVYTICYIETWKMKF